MPRFGNNFLANCPMPSGYCGGHGYASTIGTALNNLLNREDGVVIGQTFATMGLLTGLFVGIGCINYATRKGATRLVDKAESLPEDCRTGIVPKEKRTSMGEETINPMSMDPLAWHLALTLIATLCGYKFYDWYKQFLPNIELPVMCLTMIFGVIIQTILNHTKFKDSVDEHVEGRIGSMKRFLRTLLEEGISEDDLYVMTHDVPKRVLGL